MTSSFLNEADAVFRVGGEGSSRFHRAVDVVLLRGSQGGWIDVPLFGVPADQRFAAVRVQIVHDEHPLRIRIGRDGLADALCEVFVVAGL